MWSYVDEKMAVLGDASKGGHMWSKPFYLRALRVADACDADRSRLALLARKCLDAGGLVCEAQEREIDEIVVGLYGL